MRRGGYRGRSSGVRSNPGTRRRDSSYTSSELCELAGITYRQVEYWTRTGILAAANPEVSGSGTRRYYAPIELRVARVVALLAALGVAGDALRRVAESARNAGGIVPYGPWSVTVELHRVHLEAVLSSATE